MPNQLEDNISFLAGSLLKSCYNNSTTLTLRPGHGARYPSTGSFYIKIDDEVLQVTSRAIDVLTVVGGQFSTERTVHSAGAIVGYLLDATALTTISGGGGGGGGGITIDTTPITGGTEGKLLSVNSGKASHTGNLAIGADAVRNTNDYGYDYPSIISITENRNQAFNNLGEGGVASITIYVDSVNSGVNGVDNNVAIGIDNVVSVGKYGTSSAPFSNITGQYNTAAAYESITGSIFGLYNIGSIRPGATVAGNIYATYSRINNSGTITGSAYLYYANDAPVVDVSYAFYTLSQSNATNGYPFWADEQGVYRIKSDNTFDSVYQAIPALYNPLFTKYTPGAVNYERIVEQWNGNVAELGAEKGGTGTLRPLRLISNYVTSAKPIQIVETTVAGLHAAPVAGMRASVSDSDAASFTLGIGSIVVGGGSTHVPVYYDGTNWRIG